MGVNTIVTVAVEPDCSDWILHDMLVRGRTAAAGPEVALAETKVTGTTVVVGLMSSVTMMFVARSGPLLVHDIGERGLAAGADVGLVGAELEVGPVTDRLAGCGQLGHEGVIAAVVFIAGNGLASWRSVELVSPAR